VSDGEELTDVPAGKMATVITHLEMTALPDLPDAPLPDGITLQHFVKPDLTWYRDLQRRVGEPWLWYLRPAMDDAALSAIIHDDRVEVHALMADGRAEGIVELDKRVPGEVELAYFGVTPAMIGRGTGRAMMTATLRLAFADDPKRVWVHTCTADHPAALGFYLRSGFRATKRQFGLDDDPRAIGVLPVDAAPHIPFI